MNNLSEKEFDILNEISNNNALSQRDVSSNTGLSLGMTNFLIKKMIKTGLIKIHQLNKKKIQYMLTKRGFIEKTNKSYNFILKTLNRYKSIEENISKLILSEYNKGKRIFYIVGKNDISTILENSLKKLQLNGISIQTINKENIEKEKTNPNISNTTNQKTSKIKQNKNTNNNKVYFFTDSNNIEMLYDNHINVNNELFKNLFTNKNF